MRSLRRLRGNLILAFVALIAAAMPFVRESFPLGPEESQAPTLAVVHATVVAKIVTAICVFLAVFLIALRKRENNIWRRVASLPLARTVFLTGTAIAVGLASFDTCTAYHAVGSDASGACFCWLTGALAGAGALLAGITCFAGRMLVDLTRSVIRKIIALFIVLVQACQGMSEHLFSFCFTHIPSGSCLARRIAGRAPPRIA